MPYLTIDRPDYAKLAQAYRDPASNFVCDQIIPAFPVKTTKGKHRYQPEETWYSLADTRLSDSGYPNEVGLTDAFKEFDLKKLGLSHYFTAEELEQPQVYGYANANDMQREMVEFISHQIRLDKEKQASDFLNSTSNYASGFYGNPTAQWSTLSSDTLADVEAAKLKLLGPATHMIMPYTVFSKVQQNTKILASSTVFGARKDGGINPTVTPEFLSNYYGIENIIVAPARYNTTSDKPGSPTLSEIWPDNVIIAHINPQSATNQLLGTFVKQLRLDLPRFAGTEGFVVRTTEEPRRGLFGGLHIDVGYWWQLYVHAQKLGYLITNVLA